MRFPNASIDLGTNSARLLIGIIDSRKSIRPLVLKRTITRLGGGFSRERGLSQEARARSVTVLREFAADIERWRAAKVRAVATSAVRDAANGHDFIAEVWRESGLRLEIIDGREEGLLTLSGIFSGIRSDGDSFVFDIGGGSTEYTLARDGVPLFTKSLPLGVVRLMEGKNSVEAMDDKVCRELEELRHDMASAGFVGFSSDTRLIGTAGTPTTLAGINLKLDNYDSRSVNGYCLSRATIRNIFANILSMTTEQRLTVPGIERGREDLIVEGTLITIRTMEIFGFRDLIVSEGGLLEGLLLNI
ncbi:MAG TPA: exopolyphosphatase [Geobacteraceae bacterium]|nr:exopolyphosphatase [Geobacteraceae bacterium]